MSYAPQRTFSVGFECLFVTGIMHTIVYLLRYRPQNCDEIVISNFVLPPGRGGVKMVFLVVHDILHHEYRSAPIVYHGFVCA